MKKIFDKAREEVLKAIEKSEYPSIEEVERVSENIFICCGEERKREIIMSDILDLILYTLSLCNIQVSGARIRNSLEKVLKQERSETVHYFFRDFKLYQEKTACFEIYNLRKRDFFETKQWLRAKNDIEQYELWRFKEIKENISAKDSALKVLLFRFAKEYKHNRDYLEIAFVLAEKTYNMITL